MIWRSIARPLLFGLSAERAHETTMAAFNATMLPPLAWITESSLRINDARLKQRLLGLEFDNPIGMAAGFDKQARWFNSLYRLGFSHVEVGTITGEPQPGNPKPRLFRLPADRALINRMGFNNPGCDAVAARLARTKINPLLGINIGKTKVVDNRNATADYLKSFETLYRHASYFTVNVSSPNTPGLRELQDREPLLELLNALTDRNQELATGLGSVSKPILLKIAPDLTNHQLDEIVEIAVSSGIDGLIATNTTTDREGLKTSPAQLEAIGPGGLSGAPLRNRSRSVIKHLYAQLQGKLIIVGSGGVMTGDDAWHMMTSGANLVQLYTGFVYGGPTIVRNINRQMLRKLQIFGLNNISDAVGLEFRQSR